MAEIIRSALLGGVPHGFSTREGLEADDVLPGAELVRAKQVHSPDVMTVVEPWEIPPEADALVTARPGLVLSIVTADCAPVLLHDPSAQVVGAAHAGWRGAHGGVLEATVAAMEALGARADRIRAAVGPTIALASYEVDDGFRRQFEEGDARFFHEGREGHWQFDLPAYVVHRLQRAGVGAVEDLALDTYADLGRFYSFRRATHRGEDTGGRQVSVIALPQ
ncbi:peptidoglycan editing factor PgeF [Qipengyuania soli]|uniref:Purine nucleoside phosphorylase n=1 Tax=Qipengyuania soli TaxID=2782568 RepID=A0A7S8ISI7_9SPHN|nr:peptidoglycan editing factor PgeF [Qipengyuania soli]QPC98613.1 peptidoglycan editing factor PgeF [Qipengyuania soli]